MRRKPYWRPILLLIVLATSSLQADLTEYVPLGGNGWKMLPGLADATPGAPLEWTSADYDDSFWMEGVGPFGFGIAGGPFGTDLANATPPMQGSYSLVYFRHSFDVRDPDRVEELHLDVLGDDGYVVWINGIEVARKNVEGEPGTPVPANTLSTRTVARARIQAQILESPATFLNPGTNWLAAVGVNRTVIDRDFAFDATLYDPNSPDFTGPRVAQAIPEAGIVVRFLDQIEITFDEPALGVDAGDLLLGGVAATSVTGAGAGPYRFQFEAQVAGEVALTWSGDHGIVDPSLDRNDFEGEGWNYTIDPDAPIGDVVIAEIAAAGSDNFDDEDGSEEDWIEVWNRGTEAVNLGGWSLSDNIRAPRKWVFPRLELAPDARLVVFASGKHRRDPAGELHTNFRLDSSREYLGLYRAELPGEVAFDFGEEYPEQRYDDSYGLSTEGPAAATGHFDTPTPGEPNGSEVFQGYAADPAFSVERSFQDAPFTLSLSARTAARIYYTLDGSVPEAESGLLYTAPLELAGEPGRGVRLVRAVAIQEGLLPSQVLTHSYVFPEAVLKQPEAPEGFPDRWGSQPADYEMNPTIIDPEMTLALKGLTSVPTISIVTDVDNLFDPGQGVYANPSRSGILFERPVSAELITASGEESLQVNCGIRTQGGSSTGGWKSRKVSLRLLFRGKYGATKLRHRLYEGTPVDRFDTILLDAGLNLTLNHPGHDQRIRAQYVRDQFVADLQNEVGGYAPRSRFVNVFLNGLYWGMYGMHERPDASWAAEHFGGNKDDYDAMRHALGNVVDGSGVAYAEMGRVARRGLADPANYADVQEYLDVDQLARYMLANIYAGNTDWAHQNWYASRPQDGSSGYFYHSWDAEHVLKSVTESVGEKNDSGGPTEMLTLCRQNADFRLLFADTAQRHLVQKGALYVDPEHPEWDPAHPERNRAAALYMRRIDEVEAAVLLEYARWGDNYRTTQTYVRADWVRELNALILSYFPQRSDVVLGQLRSLGLYPRVEAPLLSRDGGVVATRTPIELTLPATTVGTIYYTLDGTDPRLPVSGEVSPTAQIYNGPISVTELTHVKSRTWGHLQSVENNPPFDDAWSALSEDIFRLNSSTPDRVAISELHYHPEARGGTVEAPEFLELYNPTSVPIDLSGVTFTNGVQFAFNDGARLEPGEHLVLASNAVAFDEFYPDAPLAGVFTGSLANSGETVTLEKADGTTILSLEYDDDGFWPLAADGFGRSLVLNDPDDLDADPDDPRAWRSSTEAGGSPGTADPESVVGSVVIHEIRNHSEHVIELHNSGDAAANVGGWFLSSTRENAAALQAWTIPESGAIPPGGYLVFRENEFPASLLSQNGGALYLTAPSANGDGPAYVRGVEYEAGAAGASFGRHETSTHLRFTALSVATLGADNALPRVPRVAIQEIHYHPGDGESEFIELFNPGTRPVTLAGWQLEGITDGRAGHPFVFPPGVTLAADGFLLVVPEDPNAFRNTYDVPDSATVVGPYGGGLSNSGERLRLLAPLEEAPEITYTIDTVRFNDRAPWPLTADGDGPSLERILTSAFGDEALNWDASVPLGGTPGARNSVASESESPVGYQLAGDLNQDRRLDIGDAIALLHLVVGLRTAPLPCGDGTLGHPANRTLLDSDGSGQVDLTDAIHGLAFIFQRGAPHAAGAGCVPIAGCAQVCAASP